MGSIESPTACVRHGVPQGSILGPLIFIAFINDLPLHVSSAQIDFCADDTTVTLPLTMVPLISYKVHWPQRFLKSTNGQRLISFLSMRARHKCLPSLVSDFQPELAMTLLLLSMESNLKMSDVQSFWVLEIDHELTFIPHVDKICIKLSQRIGILKRIKCCLPLKHRLLYYNTMIRPIIDYVGVVWTRL